MEPTDTQRGEIDQVLIERASSGEEKAFETLILKYQGRLAHSLRRFVKDDDEIEDIVQDTFIKAYRALPNFRGESAFFTWLYRIAVNSAKNYLASYKKKNTWLAKDAGDGEFSSGWLENFPDFNTPETDLSNHEIVATLEKATAELPADLRETVLLREVEGLSYQEISKVMKCPVGTVRSRLFRARAMIAQDLNLLLDQADD